MLKFISACILYALSCNALCASEYIGVPRPPNAYLFYVTGINDDNVITGLYIDNALKEYGFFGHLDGNYTDLEGGDAGLIYPLSISNTGWISGFTTTSTEDPCVTVPFLRSPDGVLTVVVKGGKPLSGLAAAFGSKGRFAGSYCDRNRVVRAYIGKNGKFKTAVPPDDNIVSTRVSGFNKHGDLSGTEATQIASFGFILRDGVFERLSFPGSTQSEVWGVNNSGLVTGTATFSQGDVYPFVYDSNSKNYSMLEFPSAYARGINNRGFVVLSDGFNAAVFCPLSKRKCDAARHSAR